MTARKRVYMLFIWLIIFGLIQAACAININFLALLAILAGFKKGPSAGLLAGGIIGIFTEILSSSLFGLNFALYSVVGLLSGILKESIYYKENILIEVLFSFFGVLFFYFAYFMFTGRIQASVFSTAIFSAIISPLIFRIIDYGQV